MVALNGGELRKASIGITLAGLLTMVPQASATEFCSEPVQPVCAERIGEVEEQMQRTCLDDLLRFEQDQAEYAACIAGNVRAAETTLEEVRALRECLQEKGFGDCAAN